MSRRVFSRFPAAARLRDGSFELKGVLTPINDNDISILLRCKPFFALPDGSCQLGIRYNPSANICVNSENVYTARCRWHVELLEFAQGADLLVQDAQYTLQEYPQRLGWGHSTHIDALQLAKDAGVGQLALYHHDPAHSDADIDRMVAQCRSWMHRHQVAFTYFAAAEGDCVTL